MGNIVDAGINNSIIRMIFIFYSFPTHEYPPKLQLPVAPEVLS